MRKVIAFVIAICFLLPSVLAEEDFLAISGLDEMKEYIDSGVMVDMISCDAVVYSPEPFEPIIVKSPEVATRLARSVLEWKISGHGFLRTDFYPIIGFHLANGKGYSLRFCWDSLQVDNEYYQIADNAVSALIGEMQKAAEQE